MSTTGNEFEKPGVNYPDREDADGATDTPRAGEPVREDEQQGPAAVAQSGAAEDGEGGAMPPASGEPTHQAVGIGVIDDETPWHDDGDHFGQDGGRDTLTASSAQKEGALGAEQEQRLPAMAQNNATDVDKIAGIVAQTRQDLAATQPERVRDVLAERFAQSGVSLPDAEIDELARQITTGDE